MIEPDSSEAWDSALDDLQHRRTAARAMGGEERLRKHRDAGKLDARARIARPVTPSADSSHP